MKKFLLVLSVLALCVQGIDSKVVTVDQALATAKQFATGSKSLNASGAANMRLNYVGRNMKGMNDYYVFNRDGGQGFVIVAGDDMIDPILAYSDRGSFDMSQAPEPVKIMFKRYQQALDLMRKNPQRAQAPSLTMNPEGRKPMFLNDWGEGPHWHQFAPYNNYYPTYNGEHCLAGCVPIAFAHIMKGLQYPAYGNGSNTFHYELGGEVKTATANFNHSYKYNKMPNALKETSSNWQDCAQMIYDIAVAFQAKFSTSSTNVSYDQIIKGMVAYFNYNPNVQFLQKANYADATWREMVYTELDEGRPVLYFGYRTVLNDGTQNAHVGHAFVMDGYDSEGRVRIIWGFQPEEYNSYFSFDLLSPRIYGDTPYEHDEYKEGFNTDQYAIMGIRPAEEGENGGVVVTGTTYLQEVMPANDVRGSFEVKALSGPWQGTLRWALATKGTDGKYTVATSAYTTQVDLQENETATIDISGSYYLTEGTQYYVVVWSPYFPNNYDWNWFFNDPIPFTVGDWVTPPDPQFIPGDVNNDQLVNIADVTALIDYLLDNTKEINLLAANMNDDDDVNIADVTALIDYLLNQGE
ncbi:MAG: C10 family peptidase [Muribaculaceae bacterium]|nr:C10 family peptidase [Muribaculaceae bacterium]